MSMREPAAWQCLVGGVTMHLCLGTLYLWGNIGVYIASYLRLFDPTITNGDVLAVYATAMGGQASVMVAGGYLQRLIGLRPTAFLGGWLLAVGVLLSSTVESLPPFVICYGLCFGLGIGFSYSCPLVCGFAWLPHRRGFVSGVIVAGFGGGAFVFNFVATNYVNPHNLQPEIHDEGQLYFGPEVALRVPGMLRLLGSCYLVLLTAGAAALRLPPQGLHQALPADTPWSKDAVIVSGCEEEGFAQSESGPGGGILASKNDGFPRGGREKRAVTAAVSAGRSGGGAAALAYKKVPTQEAGNLERSSAEGRPRISAPALPPPLKPPQVVLITVGQARASPSLAVAGSLGSDGSAEFAHGGSEFSPEISPHGPELSPGQLLWLPAFWSLAGCFVLSAVGGLVVAGTFKNLAAGHFASDHFLAAAASLASVSNALGRLAWGWALDKFGYGKALVALNVGAAALLSTYGSVVAAGRAPAFLLWTAAIFGFYGGNFAIFPAATAEMFGHEHAGANYGMVFTGFAVFSSLAVFLARELAKGGGFDAILDACTGVQLAGLAAALILWRAHAPKR